MNENDESTQHNSRFWFLKPRFKGRRPTEHFYHEGDVVDILLEYEWELCDDQPDDENLCALYFPDRDPEATYPSWYDSTTRMFTCGDEGADMFYPGESYNPLEVAKAETGKEFFKSRFASEIRSHGYGDEDWVEAKVLDTFCSFQAKYPYPQQLNRNSQSHENEPLFFIGALNDQHYSVDLNDVDETKMLENEDNILVLVADSVEDDHRISDAAIILSEMLGQGFRAWIEIESYFVWTYYHFLLQYYIVNYYTEKFDKEVGFSVEEILLISRDVFDLYSRIDQEDRQGFVRSLFDNYFFKGFGFTEEMFSPIQPEHNSLDDLTADKPYEF